MMDRQGVATAILSMVLETALFAAAGDAAAARRVARSANEAAAEAIRSCPGRFGGFARLPLPDVDAALAEIDYALGTLRLDGVVLLTNHDGVYLGDSRLALSGTLERCPDLRLIVPHAGGTIPFLVDRISLLADRFAPGTRTRAPAGVEDYLRRLYYDLAISANPHAVASVLQLVGPERLLYGNDWPALNEADVHSLIQVLAANPLLNPADQARIEWQNAIELFPRLRSGSAARLTVAPSATRRWDAPAVRRCWPGSARER